MREEEILDDYLIAKQTPMLFKNWVIIIWLILLLIGFIFKINHFPAAYTMIILSMAGISSYSINGYSLKSQRTVINSILALLSVIWTCYFTWEVVFNNFHPFKINMNGLILYLVATIIFYSITLLVFKIKLNRFKNK